jgi:hypothetical protein
MPSWSGRTEPSTVLATGTKNSAMPIPEIARGHLPVRLAD